MGKTLNREWIAGASAGVAGGIAMSLARAAARSLRVSGRSLPQQLQLAIKRRLGLGVREREQDIVLAEIAHLALSAALGAAFQRARLQRLLPVLPGGVLYGIVTWAVFPMVLGRVFGVTREYRREPPERMAGRLASHLLFGAVTAAASRLLTPRGQPRRPGGPKA